MPFPKQAEIELPLLEVLDKLGGKAKPSEVYPLVAKHFPSLTEEELSEKLLSYPSIRKWSNLVQWARQALIDKKQLDGSTRGVWKLTPAGRERLGKRKSKTSTESSTVTLADLVNQDSVRINARIIAELNNLTPHGFEKFCQVLLAQIGYVDLAVTKRSNDGGIDGYGQFRQGIVTIKSAFQSKRWRKSPVGRPEIDAFRGAIQGDFGHGVFLTTNRFSKDAQDASIKKGAIPVLLLDGEAIAKIMVENGLGVHKQPVYTVDLDPDFFDFDDEKES